MSWDIKLKYITESRKFDAWLSNTGGLLRTEGQSKMVQQVLRGLLAKANQQAYQRTRNEGSPAATATAAVQQVKDLQVRAVNEGFPGLVGWNVYRTVGDDWQVLNGTQVVTHTYQDTTVANGTTYYYGLKRVVLVNGVQIEEPNFVDVTTVLPSSAARYQRWILQSHCLIRPGNQMVSFWVYKNTPWYADELLNQIVSVEEAKVADPRTVKFVLALRDVNGQGVPINTTEI